MAIVFTEGWDKYGTNYNTPAASTPSNVSWGTATANWMKLMANEWTSGAGAGFAMLCAGLTGTGNAWLFQGTNGNGSLSKTLAGNYTKAVGNICINYAGFGNATIQFLRFLDGTTLQAALGLDVLGHVLVMNKSGTVIGTSSSVNTVNTVHYIAWEIQVGNSSGTYKVWVDGTLVINGTGGAFNGTANAYYNAITLCAGTAPAANVILAFDHFILDDGAGSAITTINPVIETDFATSDSAVQFANTAYAMGAWNAVTIQNTQAPGANTLFLRKFTAPSGGGTLNSVSCVPAATNATAKFKAVLYADSAGSPGSLTATGTEVVGTTGGVALVGPFSAGQTLTGGTAYWIGFITDTSVVLNESDNLTTTGWEKANTYASGAPNPAGTAGTTADPNWIIWGNLTGVTGNWQTESEMHSLGIWGDFAYTSDNTVGHEDLLGFNALSANPSSIVAVVVKGFMRDSDAGARTVTLNTKSGTTDSAGSNAGFSPTVSYGWFSSVFTTDPNTSAAWGVSGLNAATSGYKITA